MVSTSGGDGGGRVASVEGSQRPRLDCNGAERDGEGGEVSFARFVRVFTVNSESVKMPNRYGIIFENKYYTFLIGTGSEAGLPLTATAASPGVLTRGPGGR